MTQTRHWRIVLGTALVATIAGFAAAETAPSGSSPTTSAEGAHWSFRPVSRPPVPPVRFSGQVETPLDAFVLQRLEERQLTFSPPAGRRELIRRAKLDLLGLPPTPEEIEQFLADERPDAYEQLIERLLASPHYGEAWGRMWLDVVRFADTAGFNADPDRPLAYKYRDYVIRAFNEDKPFDRFVLEQIAGDEMFPESVDALTATGFDRMWPDESNASDILLARQDALNDLTASVGSVFLGLSLGCAQCHDHKFDPLLQTDFYRLQAFFSGIVLQDRIPLGTHDELARYFRELRGWIEATNSVRDELHRIETAARVKASAEKRMKFPDVVLAAIDTPPERRSTYQRQLFFWSGRQIVVDEKQILAKMPSDEKQRRPELRREFKELLSHKPRPPAEAEVMAVVEIDAHPPATQLLAGGSYTDPLEEVRPGFPEVLCASNPKTSTPEIVSPRPGTSGRRAALARWLTDPQNPLVARVIVNRVWQEHFGKGLVENANDFGTMTNPPSHPRLLDWLASEFIRQGWSIKHLHRLIMVSNIYRQSTLRRLGDAAMSQGEKVDPDNRLYWHFDRRRLTAERARDAMLFAAGSINSQMSGPGVRPKLPEGFNAREAWAVTTDPGASERRSIYIYAKRNLPHPMLKAFDLPDMNESCARRLTTTTGPQALTLLNSQDMLAAAEALAATVRDEVGSEEWPALVGRAYTRAFGRAPNDDELHAAVAFIERQQKLASGRPENSAPQPAFIDFCHALLNANEFLFVE
jgi:hypothetical protein